MGLRAPDEGGNQRLISANQRHSQRHEHWISEFISEIGRQSLDLRVNLRVKHRDREAEGHARPGRCPAALACGSLQQLDLLRRQSAATAAATATATAAAAAAAVLTGGGDLVPLRVLRIGRALLPHE